MTKLIKISTFNAIEECERQDINDLIASLVRIGYNVYLNGNYICFELGSEDEIEEK